MLRYAECSFQGSPLNLKNNVFVASLNFPTTPVLSKPPRFHNRNLQLSSGQCTVHTLHTAHVTLGTKRLARHSIAALVPQAVVACLAGKVLQRVVGTLRDGTSGFVFIAAAAAAASASCCQTAAKGRNSRSSSRYAPEVFGFNAPFCTMREPKSVCSCENVSRKRAN